MDEPRLQAAAEQRMSLLPTPMLIHLMSLLPMSAMGLTEQIQNALEENPLLERAPGTTCPSCGRHVRGRRCVICASIARPSEPVTPTDWRADLKLLVRAELPDTERALAGYVIDCLDDHGLLPAENLLADDVAGIDPRRIERVLQAIRLVGPPGIAATSPVECVRRQVQRLVDDGEAPSLLSAIVDDHLGDVAAGDLDTVAEDMAVPVDTVEVAVALLRRRVRPFVALPSDGSRLPAPDLVIHFDPSDRLRLVVATTDASWFGVRLDATLLEHNSGQAREWVEPLRRQAIDLLRQIEMRASMLSRIGGMLIECQREFLLGDLSSHRRLRRADMAALLGVHASTVGRAVDGKFLRCPDGRSIQLADCFGAQTGPKERLRVLLESHPAANDTELTRLLALDGVLIARRTVAKYRASLSVPARPGRRS